MSDLVENIEDQFSHVMAHIMFNFTMDGYIMVQPKITEETE